MTFVKFATALLLASTALSAQAKPARQWIDPDTGHKILQLTTEPGSSSPYFNENAFTPQGDKMVISVPEGIATITLKDWNVKTIVRGDHLNLMFTGHKTRNVYYSTRPNGKAGPTIIYAADVDTGKSRKIAEVAQGSIATINADETLLAGAVAQTDMPLQPDGTKRVDPRFDQAAYAANGPDGKPLSFAEAKEVRLNDRLEAKIPMEIFTIDIRTGARKKVYGSTDWLNHLQFSPTDPNLLMFCHEGPWHKVDRIWTIRTDGTGLQKIHQRTMNMEIAGHEFWSADGKTIWYDLQTPRGQVFWVAGYNLDTHKRTWYHLERNEWSVHFNVTDDGSLFAGDGGDNEMVAHAPDGKWIYLFNPQPIPDVAGIHAPNSQDLISPGLFAPEKLVNMQKHDYRLEPNVHFTPDNKWLIFRSNMSGQTQVYAVEIAKSGTAAQ